MNWSADRGRALAQAFVRLADTLIADYDVIDLLHQLATCCVGLLPVDQAGLLLCDERGHLRIVAASAERARLIELFQLEFGEGPCSECFRGSRPIFVPDLRDSDTRWPRFAPLARREGLRSVHTLPLRHQSETIGAISLFRTTPGLLSADDLELAQALADTATIGILQERARAQRELLAEQLSAALSSRVVIEQAKGVLAEREQLSVEQAFTALRKYSRSNNQRLASLAHNVVAGTVDTSGLAWFIHSTNS